MTTRDIDRATFDWADYEHFLAFGWDLDRIAARLGIRPSSLSGHRWPCPIAVLASRGAEKAERDERAAAVALGVGDHRDTGTGARRAERGAAS